MPTIWYYTNEKGEKISVTGGQLKWLAKNGKITPETIVETESGKTAPAGKVKGLTFIAPGATASEAPPPPKSSPFSAAMQETVPTPVATLSVSANPFTASMPVVTPPTMAKPADNPFTASIPTASQTIPQSVSVLVAENSEDKKSLLRKALMGGCVGLLVWFCFFYSGIMNFGGQSGTLRGHTESVRFATFSPDGKKIITASVDKTARIWDAQSGKTLRTLGGHGDIVTSASFSPDGKKVVTANYGHEYGAKFADGAKTWDAESGMELQVFERDADMVSFAAFSPDGKKIVTAGLSAVRIWDVESGRELQRLGHPDVNCATFSPDGKKVVTASSGNSSLIWDVESGKILQTLKGYNHYWYRSAVFSPDGKRIVTAHASKDGYFNVARVWDAETGMELLELKGHQGDVNFASFSPDGKKIVTAGSDGRARGTARIWDAETGKEIKKLEGHTGSVRSAVFSPDGKKIVTASFDKTARIWTLE